MQLASLVFFWFAFALYIGATVLYAYQFVLRRQNVVWWARFATGAGFILQTLSIGAASINSGGTRLDGPNQLILAAWAVVLLYFVMEHVMKIRVFGTFLVAAAAVLMAVSQFVGGGGGLKPGDPYYGMVTAFHVALIIFANAGFAFGAVSSALYLYQNSRLKARKSSKVSRRLPSLSTLQNVARRSIALAYPVYTAGLTLGIIRAIQTDVGGWWQDPRVMLSGIVWVTYGLYLVIVYRRNMSSRSASWIAMFGFALVVILGIIARTLPTGFHVFGI